MGSTESVKEHFDQLKVCVVIPTYNNAGTLAQVINDVAEFTDHIIVVNDGSTDNTVDIVQQFAWVQFISYPKNRGKGFALRTAFRYAVKHDYDYAITIDSDGQHYASDLLSFIDKLKEERNAIIIGARNMEQASVPGKSSFGNKFSNFWFKVETGINSPDTQSGFRLYPVRRLQKIQFFTVKYEFEIEVLVRAAWDGVKIIAIPVSVYYPPKEERVSHFRPFKDFTRISILNTMLVLMTYFYIKPRDFFRTIIEKKKLKQLLYDELLSPHQTSQLKAMSVAFGVFMGIVPIWGFQLVVAIFLSIIWKLNKLLVILAANISIPPMIPLIIFLSYKTGAIWMGDNAGELKFDSSITLDSIQQNLRQYLYGSITLAIMAGLMAGICTYLILKIFKGKTILTG